MFANKKTAAVLGMLATFLPVAVSPVTQAATATSPTTVVRTVKSYVAPNGKTFTVVLLKNGKYAYKPRGGRVSLRTFATSDAALKYVAANNKKAAPVAAKPVVPVPAPIVTPVYQTPADTSTRAS
ncbi:MAG: hypothetical protein WA194_04660 [Patescibacteria group bacterium]